VAFPDIDSVKETFDKLPRLSVYDVERALLQAKEVLEAAKVDALHEKLERAFSDYLRDRLWQVWGEKQPASQAAKDLSKIHGAAQRFVTALKAERGYDEMPDSIRLPLVREAEAYGQRIGGYRNHPPMVFEAPAEMETSEDGATIVTIHRGTLYHGRAQLRDYIDSLLLLGDLIGAAVEYEKSKITPRNDKNRRLGDPAMPVLVQAAIVLWESATAKPAGAGYNVYEASADGPFIRFLGALFNSISARIPGDVASTYPKLRAGLPATSSAVRSRVQEAIKSARAE
jgi:hypothetical protein